MVLLCLHAVRVPQPPHFPLPSSPQVIAVDQDPLGHQGQLVFNNCPAGAPAADAVPSCQHVWARPLKGGRAAVIFVNYATTTTKVRPRVRAPLARALRCIPLFSMHGAADRFRAFAHVRACLLNCRARNFVLCCVCDTAAGLLAMPDPRSCQITAAQVTCDAACFAGLGFSAGAAVRDLWAHEDLGVFKVCAPRHGMHAWRAAAAAYCLRERRARCSRVRACARGARCMPPLALPRLCVNCDLTCAARGAGVHGERGRRRRVRHDRVQQAHVIALRTCARAWAITAAQCYPVLSQCSANAACCMFANIN